MEYNEIIRKIAPCGLDCSRCADYEDGEIKQLSTRLKELLGGYRRVANIKKEINPVFDDYESFEKVLDLFSNVSCSGCRGDNVKCPVACHAKTCHKDKGVDFCFECIEFPCDGEFQESIRDRWEANNIRMKEIGVEDFYINQNKQPRY